MIAQARAALMGYRLVAPVAWRCTDPAEVNRFLNHPAVNEKATVGVAMPLDVAPLMADPRNRFFCGAGGGVSLNWTGPGIYQGHLFFTPGAKGRAALDVAEHALRVMFTREHAEMIWGQVHADNRAACLFVRLLGFGFAERVTAPFGVDGAVRECEVFVLRREQWTERQPRLRMVACGNASALAAGLPARARAAPSRSVGGSSS